MKKCILVLMIAMLAFLGNAQAALPVTNGLVMHLDASTISLADGEAVDVWADQSGVGNDATQATSANQPVFISSSPDFSGGRSVVRFDGTDDWMELPSSTINVGSFTMFAVAQYNHMDSNQYIIAGQDGGGNDRIRFQMDTKITGMDPQFLWRAGSSAWTGIITPADLEVHVFGETSAVEGFLDGVSIATSANSSVENPTAFNIGSYNRGEKDFFSGDLAELVIYNRVLTSQEIAEMSAYLAAKTSGDIGMATDPNPSANNTEVDLVTITSLSWLGSTEPNIVSIDQYDLVFGTEPNMLLNTAYPDVTSPFDLASNGITLDYETGYYWRVDSHITWDSNDITGSIQDIAVGEKWYFKTLPDDLVPVVTAGDNYITWLANLPQGIDGVVDDSDEGDVANADVVWSIIDSPGLPAEAAMQMYERGTNSTQTDDLAELEALGEDPDLLIDWIGTDAREVGNPMTLTLSGLPSGSYTWTSTHHDVGDQTGLFDVTVDGVSAGTGDISDSNDFPVTTFSTTIASDGSNPVKLVFMVQPYESDSEAFFVMNGFELSGTVGTLKVDFSQKATAPDPNKVGDGYQAYLATHEDAESFTAQDFAMGTATVTVLPEWGLEAADLGLINASVTKTSTDPLVPAATFTTDVAGDYTIQLTATDTAGQTDSDTLVVRVAEDACQAALWNGAVLSDYDALGNENCVVDLPDFAALALQWLEDVSLTGSVAY